jgi:hypothetical protein
VAGGSPRFWWIAETARPIAGALDKQSLSRLSDAIAVLLESEAVATLTDIADQNRVHVLDVLLGRSHPYNGRDV